MPILTKHGIVVDHLERRNSIGNKKKSKRRRMYMPYLRHGSCPFVVVNPSTLMMISLFRCHHHHLSVVSPILRQLVCSHLLVDPHTTRRRQINRQHLFLVNPNTKGRRQMLIFPCWVKISTMLLRGKRVQNTGIKGRRTKIPW